MPNTSDKTFDYLDYDSLVQAFAPEIELQLRKQRFHNAQSVWRQHGEEGERSIVCHGTRHGEPIVIRCPVRAFAGDSAHVNWMMKLCFSLIWTKHPDSFSKLMSRDQQPVKHVLDAVSALHPDEPRFLIWHGSHQSLENHLDTQDRWRNGMHPRQAIAYLTPVAHALSRLRDQEHALFGLVAPKNVLVEGGKCVLGPPDYAINITEELESFAREIESLASTTSYYIAQRCLSRSRIHLNDLFGLAKTYLACRIGLGTFKSIHSQGVFNDFTTLRTNLEQLTSSGRLLRVEYQWLSCVLKPTGIAEKTALIFLWNKLQTDVSTSPQNRQLLVDSMPLAGHTPDELHRIISKGDQLDELTSEEYFHWCRVIDNLSTRSNAASVNLKDRPECVREQEEIESFSADVALLRNLDWPKLGGLVRNHRNTLLNFTTNDLLPYRQFIQGQLHEIDSRSFNSIDKLAAKHSISSTNTHIRINSSQQLPIKLCIISCSSLQKSLVEHLHEKNLCTEHGRTENANGKKVFIRGDHIRTKIGEDQIVVLMFEICGELWELNANSREDPKDRKNWHHTQIDAFEHLLDAEVVFLMKQRMVPAWWKEFKSPNSQAIRETQNFTIKKPLFIVQDALENVAEQFPNEPFQQIFDVKSIAGSNDKRIPSVELDDPSAVWKLIAKIIQEQRDSCSEDLASKMLIFDDLAGFFSEPHATTIPAFISNPWYSERLKYIVRQSLDKNAATHADPPKVKDIGPVRESKPTPRGGWCGAIFIGLTFVVIAIFGSVGLALITILHHLH